MNCAEAEERLHELLDFRLDLTTDVSLQRHLATCHQCRQAVAEYSLIFGCSESDGGNAADRMGDRVGTNVAEGRNGNFASQDPIQLIGMGPNSDNATTRSSHSTVARLTQAAFALAVMLVLFLLPSVRALVHTSQIPVATSSERGSMTIPSRGSDSQGGVAGIDLELASVTSEIDIAAMLNIGRAFNSISLVDSDESIVRSPAEYDVPSESVAETPWDRLIASVFPANGTINNSQIQDMPWQDSMESNLMDEASSQNMLQSIEFKQPSFKEFLRVCSNPFSQS